MQLDQLNRRDFIVLTRWRLRRVAARLANAQQSEKLFKIGYLAFLRGEDSDTVLQRLSRTGLQAGPEFARRFAFRRWTSEATAATGRGVWFEQFRTS